jgi:hypothetical protein
MSEEKNNNQDLRQLQLKEKIQVAYNRIQYDRTLQPGSKKILESTLQEMEKEYKESFGGES